MRTMTIRLLALAGAAALSMGAARAQTSNPARDTMVSLGAGLQGKELEAAIAEAEKHPLGSKENPVRVNQPQGQRAYLARLRCEDGKAPAFHRAGNVGPGVYDFIVDLYKVECTDKEAVDVYMDMYHDGPENRPVPGFTIVEQ